MNTGQILRFALGAVAALCALAGVAAFGEEKIPADSPPPVMVTKPASFSPAELASFEEFLELYPVIAARLRDNPDIATNPAFQKNHPLFGQFLKRHPAVKAVLAAQPRWFVHRELVRHSAVPVTLVQVAEFNQLLDQNPQLEKELLEHPQQLRRTDFLKSHPELHAFWKRHPGIDRAAEAKPSWPARRGRRN